VHPSMLAALAPQDGGLSSVTQQQANPYKG
jgi:hypothetical protein